MSYMGILIKDEDSAREAKALVHAENAIEKENLLAVFTGGGFRLYDKNGYKLLFKDSGMTHVYDGEISDDLTKLAVKSWYGYIFIYSIPSGEKSKKLLLFDRKTEPFKSSANCGFSFDKTANKLFDIVYSGLSIINEYDLSAMIKIKTHFGECRYVMHDIGYSGKEESFWITGYERNDSSRNASFLIWTKDFVSLNKYNFSYSLGHSIYNENKSIFIVRNGIDGDLICDKTGKIIERFPKEWR